MSGFDEVRFPPEISYGSKGGPNFKTTVTELESGAEKRNQNWSRPRWEFDVQHGVKTWAQAQQLRSFFVGRRGKAYGFRFKDWGDYAITNQAFGTGDGARTTFQLRKSYDTTRPFVRDIVKPVANSIPFLIVGSAPMVGAVKILNIDFTVDWNTGIVTFVAPPAAGQIISCPLGEFDVPVRFDTDLAEMVHDTWNTESWPSIPLVEVRK